MVCFFDSIAALVSPIPSPNHPSFEGLSSKAAPLSAFSQSVPGSFISQCTSQWRRSAAAWRESGWLRRVNLTTQSSSHASSEGIWTL